MSGGTLIGWMIALGVVGLALLIYRFDRKQRQSLTRSDVHVFVDRAYPAPAEPDDPQRDSPAASPAPRPWTEQPGVAEPFPQHPRYVEMTAASLGFDDQVGLTVRQPDELPTFADVGGMEALKQELRDTIGLLLEHADDADRYAITWNGVLLHGPPGVGKTHFAQAVAGELGLRLLHVSTGDLVSSFAGGSARNVARVFELAERARPCLLFFDEFDSIAQRRDHTPNHEDRRTVNQLLTSLEEHRGHRDLVVMAATNTLDGLDPAAIRPGRFDRHVRVDLPDRQARRAVLAAQLAPRPVDPDVDLDELARRTEGTTPAALGRMVERASLAAFREAAASGDVVHVSMAHLEAALTADGGDLAERFGGEPRGSPARTSRRCASRPRSRGWSVPGRSSTAPPRSRRWPSSHRTSTRRSPPARRPPRPTPA